MKSTALISIAFLLFLAAFAPSLSDAILRQAKRESGLRLTVIPNSAPDKNGWYSKPVQVTATASSPEVVITYAINGRDALEGDSLLLKEPGEYRIEWNACKGESCHEGFVQAIKILPANLRQLSYDPDRREWSFGGIVTDVRQATLLGQPGQVARVQGTDFAVWVALKVQRLQLTDAAIRHGDQVLVSIDGPHVLLNEVDWSQCGNINVTGVSSFEYCAMGATLDDGLLNLDTGYKLSPSNELIRSGRAAQRWQAGVLYWNTSLLQRGFSISSSAQNRHEISR
ncbi:MAG: hypothetical protein L6461_21655 [Anaerolineae bacterium]|nr:hypothetical protein [Anaerolineae bacterium]